MGIIAFQTFNPLILLLLLPNIFFIIILLSSKIHCISDSEALLNFKSFLLNTEALASWDPNTPPCKGKKSIWDGVRCYEGIVSGLRLKSMGLSGDIDVNSLTNLPGLRTISLEDNKFGGPMPELNRLGALKAIYLSNNNFTGSMTPDFFKNMESLKKLWLANNSFTGEIPSSLARIRNLIELHLENNQFSGVVPPLKQPPLVALDLSNNQLEGEIPESLVKFKETSFGGNANLCGEVVGKPCTVATPPPEETLLPEETPPPPAEEIPPPPDNKSPQRLEARRKRRLKWRMGIVLGLILIILSMVMVIIALAKKRRKEQEKENIPTTRSNPNIDTAAAATATRSSGKGQRKGGGGGGAMGDLTMVNNEKGVFGLADLMKASAQVLGTGSMGSAYKAILGNGLGVVVKRMRELNRLEKDAFDVEMKRLAILRHKNILPPLAYHYRKEEKLVVYEYVRKGSLHYILHGDRGKSHEELNWPTRLKIIKGIAEGLSYLHSQLKSNELPHGNLKSSNIMISLYNEPLLSDYGFSPLTNPNVMGNALFGYRSPESMITKVSHKSDVYCLGVVILEIITCKFPSQYLNSTKGGTNVVQWVVSAIEEGREVDLIDPGIMSNSTKSTASMVKMLYIGAACTEPNPDNRPSLSEAKERIDKIEVHDGGGQDSRTINVV